MKTCGTRPSAAIQRRCRHFSTADGCRTCFCSFRCKSGPWDTIVNGTRFRNSPCRALATFISLHDRYHPQFAKMSKCYVHVMLQYSNSCRVTLETD